MMTVAEPVRDDEDYDAHELVPCDACHGTKAVKHERADGTVVRASCRRCSSLGVLLRGNQPGHPYEVTHDFCVGLYDCCTRLHRG